MLNNLKYSIESFVDIFFPRHCKLCNIALTYQETEICILCFADLPFTYSWEKKHYNPMKLIFEGRFNFHYQYALLNFEKKGIAQKLIHHIKYNNEQQLAFYLGSLFGQAFNFIHKTIDYLLPVPLHPKKLKKRGFNQALLIAQGIQSIWHLPILTNTLIKSVDNISQTTLNRQEKIKNVQNVFSLNACELPHLNKHIMLIDDVCTTGATIESCALTLSASSIKKISVGTIAVVSPL